MSIKKYTNFEGINSNSENEGQFLQMDDLFIVSKKEIEESDFGDCKYDVMEVSIYDINNNLLPHKNGTNVAYIKKEDIKNYLYQITNKGGQKELAINIEILLNKLGFTNGIFKVNINFVRQRVGSDNTLERVWIHEISPSREEIRIVPLKTKDAIVNARTKNEFDNLKNLNKDFKYYRKSILDSVNSFEGNFLEGIDSALQTKFGKDFFQVLKKDFGLSNFPNFRKKIYEDFKTSINYYLTNKHYDVRDSKFGKPSEIRFEDCDQYEFAMLTNSIQTILFNCIEHNTKVLKRRAVNIKTLPKEFAVTELRKEIANNLESFKTTEVKKRNVYSPDKVLITLDDLKTGLEPIMPQPPIEIIKSDPVPVDIPVVVLPKEVIVAPQFPTFEYKIRDTSVFNGKSVIKFIDADGKEMQKEIPYGKSITICARENSISNAEVKAIPGFLGKLLGKKQKASPTLPKDLSIVKGKECNVIDISKQAPTSQNKNNPRGLFGRGGVNRSKGVLIK
jgi:hypothetical protein